MKSLSQLSSDFSRKAEAIRQLETRFPAIIGVETVKIIKQNFTKQGYEGSLWKKRSPNTDKLYDYNRTADYRTPKLGKKSKYKNPYEGSVVSSKRPILTQTGNLRDSITYNASGKSVTIGVFAGSKKDGSLKEARIYAKLMNEGGPFKAWNHNSIMPRRQYMPFPNQGPSKIMIAAYRKKYKYELDKIMGSMKQ